MEALEITDVDLIPPLMNRIGRLFFLFELESEPVTSTPSGIALASALLSSFRLHQTDPAVPDECVHQIGAELHAGIHAIAPRLLAFLQGLRLNWKQIFRAPFCLHCVLVIL